MHAWVKLDLSYNKIEFQGAEALANSSLLLNLNLHDNDLGILGASALARSKSIRSLNVISCCISQQGGEAFMSNTLLTSLKISLNRIDSSLEKNLVKHIINNRQTQHKAKDHFLRTMLILAKDTLNINSSSLFSLLPSEILMLIIENLDFLAMGKTKSQLLSCAHFIFSNIEAIWAFLKKAHQAKSDYGLNLKERFSVEQQRWVSRFFLAPIIPEQIVFAHLEAAQDKFSYLDTLFVNISTIEDEDDRQREELIEKFLLSQLNSGLA